MPSVVNLYPNVLMINFCTITPSRGDRPQFLEHCKYMLSRMTIKPSKSYFIDHKPRTPDKDLVERIQMGIALAKQDGFDLCYIVEDDDFYPADYFERMAFLNNDIVGDESTTYYHLKNQGIQHEKHPYRASLFTTGFRISAIEGMQFPEPNNVWLDLRLWEFAKRKRLKRRFAPSEAIGIKHSFGLTAGIGHKEKIYRKFDEDFKWLKSKVDKHSLDFYMSVHEQYKLVNSN